MAVRQRLTPTLFDKLVCDLDLWQQDSDGDLPPPQADTSGTTRDYLRYYWVAKREKFNERALRATIRRELGWLLATTNLESLVDLEPYPNIRDSVLNYGLPDLVGQTIEKRSLHERAKEIRRALRMFEPRLEKASLKVDPDPRNTEGTSIAFMISGDITAAAKALPVKLRTQFDSENKTVDIRE